MYSVKFRSLHVSFLDLTLISHLKELTVFCLACNRLPQNKIHTDIYNKVDSENIKQMIKWPGYDPHFSWDFLGRFERQTREKATYNSLINVFKNEKAC